MRQHVHLASRRRDERLAAVRRMTLWITGGAAVASLGFGTVFAHAAAGHFASTQGTSSSGSAGASPSPGGTQHSQAPSQQSQHSQQAQLSQPAQQPTQTTAPPVVTSGGS